MSFLLAAFIAGALFYVAVPGEPGAARLVRSWALALAVLITVLAWRR